MKRSALPALAWLTLSAAAFAQGSFDHIVLYEGTPKKGTVTGMTKDAVSFEVTGGVATQVQLNNIKQIIFADAPTQLRSALTAIAAGEFEDAIDKLKPVNTGDIQRDFVAQEVLYFRAYCLARLALAGDGDKTVAGKAMGEFAKNEGSYHFYDANEIMGDLASSLGKPDAAATFYGKVGGAPWPDFKMKAAVLEGQALAAQDKHQEAYAKFQEVMKSDLNTPVATRMKERATLGRAVCLSEAGKPDEAIVDVEKIITGGDSKDGELFARAYNALGACHRKAGRTKDALLAYLHVDLMFSQDPLQHAEALYHLRALWKDADKTEESLKARDTLKQRYSGTVWANKPE